MDSKKKTKRIYHISVDVVDDIKRFAEETGNKSTDLDFVPDHVMFLVIKKAIERFGNIPSPGVYIINSEIRFPIPDKEERDDERRG